MPTIKRKKWTEHPSIVFEGYTDKKPRLDVFYNFEVDKNLPKFEKREEKSGNEKSKMTGYKRGFLPNKERRVSWLAWAKHIWDNPPWRRDPHDEVEESMAQAKEAVHAPMDPVDAETVRQRIIDYAGKVRSNGQVELAARLAAQADIMTMEIMLTKAGVGRYLDESDMVELFKKADFGLRLDWLSRYTEFIPDDIVEKKKKLDALKIFDNYAILHYDPQGKKLQEIEIEEREEARRLDPILFGLIEGADRLYFIADWTTDKDDVTMSKVLKILGRDRLAETTRSGDTDALMSKAEFDGFLDPTDQVSEADRETEDR